LDLATTQVLALPAGTAGSTGFRQTQALGGSGIFGTLIRQQMGNDREIPSSAWDPVKKADQPVMPSAFAASTVARTVEEFRTTAAPDTAVALSPLNAGGGVGCPSGQESPGEVDHVSGTAAAGSLPSGATYAVRPLGTGAEPPTTAAGQVGHIENNGLGPIAEAQPISKRAPAARAVADSQESDETIGGRGRTATAQVTPQEQVKLSLLATNLQPAAKAFPTDTKDESETRKPPGLPATFPDSVTALTAPENDGSLEATLNPSRSCTGGASGDPLRVPDAGNPESIVRPQVQANGEIPTAVPSCPTTSATKAKDASTDGRTATAETIGSYHERKSDVRDRMVAQSRGVTSAARRQTIIEPGPRTSSGMNLSPATGGSMASENTAPTAFASLPSNPTVPVLHVTQTPTVLSGDQLPPGKPSGLATKPDSSFSLPSVVSPRHADMRVSRTEGEVDKAASLSELQRPIQAATAVRSKDPGAESGNLIATSVQSIRAASGMVAAQSSPTPHLSPTSTSTTFDRMDSAAAPRVIESTPQRLIVGVHSAGLGWLEIHTNGTAGQVSATLATSSAASHDAISAQLPTVREYLAAEHVRVDSLAAERFSESPGGQGNTSGNQSRDGDARQPTTMGSGTAAEVPSTEVDSDRLSYISVRV
jgi:hypothetical protein